MVLAYEETVTSALEEHLRRDTALRRLFRFVHLPKIDFGITRRRVEQHVREMYRGFDNPADRRRAPR